MCSLFVLLGVDPEFPIFVAANRDEDRARLASPPGLFVGERRRMLSPRDRRAGGTWMAVNDRMWFAGLTNVAGVARRPEAGSRGVLPHLVLDADDLDAGVAEVERAVAAGGQDAFRLLATDGRRALLVSRTGGALRVDAVAGPVFALSNEHALGELTVPGLDRIARDPLPAAARLDALAPLLLERGTAGRHAVLKTGGAYGTVSSSLLALPRADPGALLWRYAPGPPDVTAYRNYGNLGRRLRAE